jgi:hypothetical protein
VVLEHSSNVKEAEEKDLKPYIFFAEITDKKMVLDCTI